MARRVLIADDSATTYHQLRKILESSGEFQVVAHAVNGDDAVEKYDELRPDLVTMDIVMPGLDGLGAVRAIIAIDPAAKIVVASSMGGVKDKVVALLSAGAKNVLVKPFDADKVLAVLRAL